MLPGLSVEHRSWPLAVPFRISRGVKESAEVVVVTLRDGAYTGRGESVPYARYDETVASVTAQVMRMADAIASGIDRQRLQALLPAGAARNAIDCALWDLEAQRRRTSVSALLGTPPPAPLPCAQTISLDTPGRMARAAAAIADLDLIKIKVSADDPATRIRAVRAHAPSARLIVDPNESWTLDLLQALQPVLVEARVDLVEQPLPAGEDDALQDFRPAVPLCADESCHVAADLPRLRDRYQVINIKLDKSGGLTGALELRDAARASGFGLMVGCMVCSSLGIAPALQVARDARFVDLDGPLWLRDDHPGGVARHAGRLQPPAAALWGGGPEADDRGEREGAATRSGEPA